MANLIGEPFDEFVSKQIDARQKIFGKKFNRTQEEIQYLNSRGAWIKLASGVEVDTGRIDLLAKNGNPMVSENDNGTALARKNVLFNGLSRLGGQGSDSYSPTDILGEPMYQRAGLKDLGDENLKAYGVGGNDFGYSPMPGITDIKVKDLNRGSLKQADITIIANNRNQFDVIDVLYMRLGMSVLLEWGYDKYIDNNRELQTQETTLIEEEWFDNYDRTYQDWLPKISSRRKETNGNYDAIFGTITNFSWTFEEDGSYKISLKLMSLGDIIESLKVNLPPTSIKLDPNKQAQLRNRAVTFGASEALSLTQFYELYPDLKGIIERMHTALLTAGSKNETILPLKMFVDTNFARGNVNGIMNPPPPNKGSWSPSLPPFSLINRVPLLVPGHTQAIHAKNNILKNIMVYPLNSLDVKSKENIDENLWDAMLFAIHAMVEGKVGGDLYFGDGLNVETAFGLDQIPWLESFQTEPYESKAYQELQQKQQIFSSPNFSVKRVKTTSDPIGGNVSDGGEIFPKSKTGGLAGGAQSYSFEHPFILNERGFTDDDRRSQAWKVPSKTRTSALKALLHYTLASVYSIPNNISIATGATNVLASIASSTTFTSKSPSFNTSFIWEGEANQNNDWEEENKNYYIGEIFDTTSNNSRPGVTGASSIPVSNVITSIVFANIPLENFEQLIFEYFKIKNLAGGEEDPQFEDLSESEDDAIAIEANQDINRVFKYFYEIREYYKNVRKGNLQYGGGSIKVPNPEGPTFAPEGKSVIGYVVNPILGNKLKEWQENPQLYPEYTNDSDSRDIIQLKIEPLKFTHFIRLGTFLQFLQDRIIPDIVSGNKYASLINIDTKKDGNICYYVDNVISNDIRKCIVANYSFYNGVSYEKIFEELEYYKGPKSSYAYGRIMNVYFNFNRLEEIFNKENKKGNINLFEVCKTISDDINSCLGNINNIEPVINKETNTITFIDQTPIPNLDKISLELEDYKDRAINFTSESTLEVLGYNESKDSESTTSNFVRKVGITTKIDKNYATMITIGATANGSIPGMEATAFSKWNVGITDRFKKSLADSSNSSDSLEKQNESTLITYNLFINSSNKTQAFSRLGLNAQNTISEDYIKFNKSTISNYYNYAQAKTSLETGGIESSIGFLPFDLKLTLDGISGIKIYNRIKVNTDFLPSNYPETLKFIVTGVNHKIDNSDWITDINTLATSNLQQDKKVVVINTPKLLNSTPKPKISSPSVEPVTVIETTEEEGKLPNRTRPNKFPFTWKNYGSKSRGRAGNLNNPKARDLGAIKAIYLHHTATPQVADKGESIIRGWNGAWASSNVVIDANGHREYMIESKYIANTQGNHIEPARTNYNDISVAVEMQCDGWYSAPRTDIPGHEGKKMYGRSNFRNSRYVDESKISAPYDFNLKNIGKFKGQRYLQEYTSAQLTSLAEWIKEKIIEIGGEMLNWKFNEHTYKQMFPNKYKTGLTSTPVIEDGILFRNYWVQIGGVWKVRTKGYGISPDAYNFVPGIYTHSSIVSDKTDLCPTKGIVTMLKQNFS